MMASTSRTYLEQVVFSLHRDLVDTFSAAAVVPCHGLDSGQKVYLVQFTVTTWSIYIKLSNGPVPFTRQLTKIHEPSHRACHSQNTSYHLGLYSCCDSLLDNLKHDESPLGSGH